MNADRDKLAEKLREIATGSRRNKTARLREIFDEVEAAKAAGASNKAIVAGLAEHGLIFDVNNFKNARSRILKERAMSALTQVLPAPQSINKKTVLEGKKAGETKPGAAGKKVVPEVKKAGETKTGGGGLLSDLVTPVHKANIPDSEL